MNVQLFRKSTAAIIVLTAIAFLGLFAAGRVASPSLMTPWSSLAYLTIGVALWIDSSNGDGSYLRAGALLAFGIGAIVCVEYLAGAGSTAFDRLIFPTHLPPGALLPGRPAPLAGFRFCLLGVVLFLARSRNKPVVLVREWSAIAVITICYFGFVSVMLEWGTGAPNSISPFAGILGILAGANLLATGQNGHFLQLLQDRGPAGMIARSLMPAAMLIPLLHAILSLVFRYFQLFDSTGKVALLSINILTAITILWMGASKVQSIDLLRRAAEDALSASVERLRLAQQVSQVGTFEWNIQTGVSVWTPELEAMYGLPPGGFAGTQHTWEELLHPDDRPETLRRVSQAIASGDFEGEWRVTWPDGTIRWLIGRASVLPDATGKPLRMIGINMDVTDRKQAQEALKEINLLNQLELAVQSALAPDIPLPAALQECCAILVRALDGAFARIWTMNQNRTVLELQASAGIYTHIDGAHRHIPIGQFKIGRIALEKQPLLTNNVVGDPSVHDQDWAKSEGMVGFAGYPLLVEDRTIGVLAMFSQHPLPDVALRGLALVADRIALSIERKRTEDERENLRAQLAQSQKMESVGRLAGGIAHDFSNLMSVILLHNDSALEELKSDDPLIQPLTEIRKAAERAVGVTQQLMAFSRKRVLQTEVVNLNAVIAECEKLMRPMIVEDIHLLFIPGGGLGLVRADRGQLGQVIMNLVLNSRDAMPHGGTLTIETANVDLDEGNARKDPETKSGSYVSLAVRDTGAGMDKETRARLFEPFFTTKEVGKGTGLGLSMVYGIVKQSGGFIQVHSEVGLGAEFRIYLPRVPEAPEPDVPIQAASRQRAVETVLVVEDEPALREPVCRLLKGAGYRVLAGKDVNEAIQIAKQHKGSLDLLLTDVVMPILSGPQLAKYLRPLHPGMKVLYMSGHPEPRQSGSALLPEVESIQKPFTKQKLLTRLREVLECGELRI